MYDIFSEDYDRFVNWEARLEFEIPFIETHLRRLAHRNGGPAALLDAACGTGMHAIGLAKRGFRAAGADLSPGMIEKAQANAAAAGLGVHFETAGFGDLAAVFGMGEFDAVLCLGNSLPHLLAPDDLAKTLSDFAKCLRRDGLLLIQNRNFDGVIKDRQRWMEPQGYKEGDDEWIFIRFYDYEPHGLINFNVMTLKRQGKGGWRQQVVSSLMRPQLNSDLTAALKEAGFGEIQTFGSLGGEDYNPLTSGNLVLMGRRT